jgi:hypothetical protein
MRSAISIAWSSFIFNSDAALSECPGKTGDDVKLRSTTNARYIDAHPAVRAFTEARPSAIRTLAIIQRSSFCFCKRLNHFFKFTAKGCCEQLSGIDRAHS